MSLNIEYYEKELGFWRGESLRLRKQIDELHENEVKRLTAQIEGSKIGIDKKAEHDAAIYGDTSIATGIKILLGLVAFYGFVGFLVYTVIRYI